MLHYAHLLVANFVCRLRPLEATNNKQNHGA